jgi:vitamin B12 transporter
MFFSKYFTILFVCFFYPVWVGANERSDDAIEILTVYDKAAIFSSHYQILSRKDFINTSQTLSDLLQAINGLQIRQIGGLGNPVSVSIRGSSSKQVQLYIDGQLVNDSQFGGFDLNQIPTEQIQSIEISKNQAIGTGSTPIGGVIRINTFNPVKVLPTVISPT